MLTTLACCGTCAQCELTFEERNQVCPPSPPTAEEWAELALAEDEVEDLRDQYARDLLLAAGLCPAF